MKNKMSSEQRLLAALSLQEPDRVPIWLYINPFTDSWLIEDPSYNRVMDFVANHCDIFYTWSPPSQGLFYSDVELPQESKKLESQDGLERYESIIKTPKGKLNCITRYNQAKVGAWTEKHWLETEADVEKFLSIPTKPLKPEVSEFFEIKQTYGSRVLMQVELSDPVCAAGYFKPEQLAIWIKTHKKMVVQVLEVMFERIYNYVKYLLSKGVGPVYYFVGPEYAIPPLMSPELFDEFVVKYDKELVGLVHNYDCLTIIHCHGCVNKFLEKFVEIGTDALHPLEAPPMGDVILSEAKKRIGDKICLIGNIEYNLLYACSPAQMSQRVKEVIEQAAPGGGFILSVTASPYNSPIPEKAVNNYIELISSGLKFGQYE